MTPKILLDRAARDELKQLLRGHHRPPEFPPITWHQVNMGTIAALDCRYLAALSDLLGSNLIYKLREASEKAAYCEVYGPDNPA